MLDLCMVVPKWILTCRHVQGVMEVVLVRHAMEQESVLFVREITRNTIHQDTPSNVIIVCMENVQDVMVIKNVIYVKEQVSIN